MIERILNIIFIIMTTFMIIAFLINLYESHSIWKLILLTLYVFSAFNFFSFTVMGYSKLENENKYLKEKILDLKDNNKKTEDK